MQITVKAEQYHLAIKTQERPGPMLQNEPIKMKTSKIIMYSVKESVEWQDLYLNFAFEKSISGCCKTIQIFINGTGGKA